MNYLIIVILTYLILKWIEPIFDVVVTWVQTIIQIDLQYKSLDLQTYAESFEVKESVIGFSADDEMKEVQCPMDCESCEYDEMCEYYGEYLKANKTDKACGSNVPIGKVDNSPKCVINRIGFIQN
jgi:hypothetical protein